MKKIAFVIPWGGTLPEYFPLWMKTCERNPSVDFLLFTDDKSDYLYPENVKPHFYSWEELVHIFQRNFSFEISLSKSYKFCDFKPAYGEIFREWLKDYDFWGHCDIDLLWGDIRGFLLNDILEKYDRIFSLGSCCLYRNTEEVNSWYRTMPRLKYQSYMEVFQTDASCCFDEWGGHCGGGLSYILRDNGVVSYDERVFADLNFSKGYFEINGYKELSRKRDLSFRWENGKLFSYSGSMDMEKEWMYVHFQKRKIEYDGIDPLKLEDRNHFTFNAPGKFSINGDTGRSFFREMQFSARYWQQRIKRKLRQQIL